MKKYIIAILAIGLIAVIAFGSESTRIDPEENSANSAVQDARRENLSAAIASINTEDAVVLDVRTTQEWSDEHAVGALHFSLEERMVNGELPAIDKDEKIYVYCRTGNRSAQAISIMEQAGFTNLTNIYGLTDWKSAGGPTE